MRYTRTNIIHSLRQQLIFQKWLAAAGAKLTENFSLHKEEKNHRRLCIIETLIKTTIEARIFYRLNRLSVPNRAGDMFFFFKLTCRRPRQKMNKLSKATRRCVPNSIIFSAGKKFLDAKSESKNFNKILTQQSKWKYFTVWIIYTRDMIF